MRVHLLPLTLLTRYRTKFREFLGEASHKRCRCTPEFRASDYLVAGAKLG